MPIYRLSIIFFDNIAHPYPVVEEIFDKVYGKFVCEVDAHDNNIPIADGPTNYVSCTSLPKRVSYLVPRWTETNPDYDSAFDKAMTLVGDEFKDMVNHYGKDWWPARKVVEKAVEERFDVHGSGRVINLPSTGELLISVKIVNFSQNC